MKYPLHKFAIITVLLVGFTDFMAQKFYLYWTISWFDMFVHFLGGLAVSVVTVLFWHRFIGKLNSSRAKVFWVGFLGVMIIGTLWEAYEFYFGISVLEEGMNIVRDTTSDYIMDILGGLFGSLYSYRILKSERDININV